MKKSELKNRTDAAVEQTKNAIQLIWDQIVKGQQIRLIKDPRIKTILDRYGVNYREQ